MTPFSPQYPTLRNDITLALQSRPGVVQSAAVQTGTDNADTLTGTAGDDLLRGLAGDDLIFGNDGNDRIAGGDGSDTLDGGAGMDWLDNSTMNQATIVVLMGGVSWNNDGSSDAVINFENVAGTRFDDALTGDGNSNILRGGAGADRINGFDGDDWADYRGSRAGVAVNLSTGVASGGDASGDSVVNIERLMGSANADALTGDGQKNVIRGGAGGDTLDGSANFDWVDYRGSIAGVTVNLANGTASGGDATGDSIANFERVFGSAHDDALTGDAGANMLYGGAGNDTLTGGAGMDVYRGDAGADTFVFSSVADIGIGRPPERVIDFTHGDDLLDFSGMDLTFIGDNAFSNVAGELRYERHFAAVNLFGDSDGDGDADFQILLTLNTEIVSADLTL